MRVDEYNDFSSLLTNYRRALSQVESLGVKLSPSSRWRQYERRLQQSLDDPRPAVEEDFVIALAFDLREIDELIEIVGHLPNPPDPATIQLLNRLKGGSEHPDDETSAPAREAQYELYLGAVLRRAGLLARHGAPDLVVQWQGQDYFIEAKRPSSPARIDDRVRSAIHQIRKLPSAGILALSLDQVVRPSDILLSAPRLDAIASTVAGLVQAFVVENIALWRKRLESEPVAVILMTARVPGRLTSTGHLVLGSNIHAEILSPPTEANAGQFVKRAIEAYQKAQAADVL